MYVNKCIHVYIRMYKHMSMSVSMSMSMYVYVYIYMYMYISIYVPYQYFSACIYIRRHSGHRSHHGRSVPSPSRSLAGLGVYVEAHGGLVSSKGLGFRV